MTRELFFGQSEIRLALSVSSHSGESGMSTPPWRTGLVWNAETTQSREGSVETTGWVQILATRKCILCCQQKEKV